MKSFSLALLFLLIAFSTFSAERVVTGCILDSEPNVIYIGGGTYKRFYIDQWNRPEYKNFTKPTEEFSSGWYNSYGACKYFSSTPQFISRCSVEGKSYVSGTEVRNLGNYTKYTLTDNCKTTNVPLDDYLWVLVLAAGGFFAFQLKQKIRIVKL